MARTNFSDAEYWVQMARQTCYSSRQLPKVMEISPRQLNRYTRQLFQRSPQAWLNEQRLLDAADLLRGNQRVKAVAYQLGYKHVSHFCAKFKQRYGVSPRAFAARKQQS